VLTLAIAILAGLLAGYALGGRLRNLEGLNLSLTWLVILALAVQIVIFSPLTDRLGETVVVTAHLATYGLLLVFVAANRRNVGIVVAGVGIALNAAVIAANGGYMPASRAALEFAGLPTAVEPHNNSAVADGAVRLLPLGDVMAVPDWVPLIANVFSVGDLLISVGVAVMLATAMRGPASIGMRGAVGVRFRPRRRHRPGPSPEPDIEAALDALAASVSRLTAFCAAARTEAADKALGAAVALVETCEALIEERADDPGPYEATTRAPGLRHASGLRAMDGEPEAR
jgi:hypothetical protein